MVARAFEVEIALYAIVTFFHVVAGCVMVFRLHKGMRPSRTSKSACYLGLVCVLIEVIRAVDPSAAFEIYEGRYLPLMAQSISVCIMIVIAHVTYEVINVIFIEATRKKGKKHRSKGLAKIKRTVKFVSFTCIFVGLLTAILVAADNRQLYVGIWSIWMGICLVVIIAQLSLGGRWLRRRLRRYFKKQYPNDPAKVRAEVRNHVERLTYFRYSLVGLMLFVIVVMLITGVAEIASSEEVNGANPNDYDFFEFYPMWIQLGIVTVMLWFGWVPASMETQAAQPSDIFDEEAPKSDKELRIEERTKYFTAAAKASSSTPKVDAAAGGEDGDDGEPALERMDTETMLRMEQMKRYSNAPLPKKAEEEKEAPPLPLTDEEKADLERERILLENIQKRKNKQAAIEAAIGLNKQEEALAEDADESEDDAEVAKAVAEDEDDDEVHEDSEPEEAPAVPVEE